MPVADLDTDLEYTAFGAVFSKANLVVNYVTIVASTQEEATTESSGDGHTVLMKYTRVTPLLGSRSPFAMEAVTPISKVRTFDMADDKPRLIVGACAKMDEHVILMAERIFTIGEGEVAAYEKEMQHSEERGSHRCRRSAERITSCWRRRRRSLRPPLLRDRQKMPWAVHLALRRLCRGASHVADIGDVASVPDAKMILADSKNPLFQHFAHCQHL